MKSRELIRGNEYAYRVVTWESRLSWRRVRLDTLYVEFQDNGSKEPYHLVSELDPRDGFQLFYPGGEIPRAFKVLPRDLVCTWDEQVEWLNWHFRG